MHYNREYKVSGIATTIIFHIAVIFLFLYFGFRTPLPLPAEQGILVNFGDDLEGAGTIEPKFNEPINPVQSEAQPVTQPDEPHKDPLTQDYEDAPAIKAKKETKKEEKKVEKPVAKKEIKKEAPKPKTEPVKEERKANPLALYPAGKGTTNSNNTNEGITGGKGNQGNPNGSPDSKNYSNIAGGGGGVSFSLSGRAGLNLPAPDYNYQVEGTVVVEVTVDKEGTVTQAIPGVKGSTTLNEELLNAAKKAALKARFDRKPDAPAYQKGTITYRFRLN
jgi:TonB family protein